jgi:hypothetical protein
VDPRLVKDLRYLKDRSALDLFLEQTLPGILAEGRAASDLTVTIDLVDDRRFWVDVGAKLLEVVGARSRLDERPATVLIVSTRAGFEQLLSERASGSDRIPAGVTIIGQKGRKDQLLALLS